MGKFKYKVTNMEGELCMCVQSFRAVVFNECSAKSMDKTWFRNKNV